MTVFDAALILLLERLRQAGKQLAYIDWDSVQEWPPAALEAFLRAGILSPASQAQSIECPGCEHHCFMDVVTRPGGKNIPTRSFVVCNVPGIQERIGRVNISLEQLQRWQCSAAQLAQVLVALLGFEGPLEHETSTALIRLGMLKGSQGRRWVSLEVDSLALQINQQNIPIEELLYFESEQLVLDMDRIGLMVNILPSRAGKKYEPSTDKREARKFKTQAMYQDWIDEYHRIQKKHPEMSDTWISKKIARMEIAQDKNSETIRKNMKD
jgi:hypothetical protein